MALHSDLKTQRRTRKQLVVVALGITLLLLTIVDGGPLARGGFFGLDPTLSALPSPVSPLSSKRIKPDETLSAGKLLVASRNLRDPNFAETVVLLIEYDWYGAMGLIINRPTDVKLSKLFPETKELQRRQDTAYIGGPVGKSKMLLLIRSPSQPDGSRPVFNDIYVSGSQEVLERMIDGTAEAQQFRLFVGHAGWVPGQLDREISRGSWHVVQADTETVFDKAPGEIWPDLIRRSSVLWVKVPEVPRQVAPR
ncbi:MAG: YqgE/AlgH family protein [Deltaproteobacteria bacterium]|nr:MAG: YqgE/AlgH family protein [Deltaproteobacteria bacterium]